MVSVQPRHREKDRRDWIEEMELTSIVGLLDEFLIIVEFDHDANGAEDFLFHDLHIGFDVGEDCRFDEVTFGTMAFATEVYSRTVRLARFDIGHDPLWIKGSLASIVENGLSRRGGGDGNLISKLTSYCC